MNKFFFWCKKNMRQLAAVYIFFYFFVNKMRLTLSILAGLLLINSVHSAVPNDQVTNLPGFGPVLSSTYSGYLNAGNGKYLHYFLTYSLNNPTKDPLVLWFNGKYLYCSFYLCYSWNYLSNRIQTYVLVIFPI